MQNEFWQARWEAGEIGFHQQEINPYLRRFWPGLQVRAGGKVLVPLCGKSRDLCWLAEQGHAVLGIEIVPAAVKAFFEENGIQYRRSARDKFEVWEGARTAIWCGDFFDLQPDEVGVIDAVYDRASLVALPPMMRDRYARKLASLVRPETRVLLVTMEYPEGEMEGPPFSVTAQALHALYAGLFTVTPLYAQDVLADNPRFKERGLTRLEEKVYALRRCA